MSVNGSQTSQPAVADNQPCLSPHFRVHTDEKCWQSSDWDTFFGVLQACLHPKTKPALIRKQKKGVMEVT